MPRAITSTFAVGLLLLSAPVALAQPARDPAQTDQEVRALAARIDEHINARLRERGVPPAEAADDATFLRRVYLDLSGRIPDLVPARDFLENPAPDKRDRLVRELLTGRRYPLHMANVWGQLFVPPSSDPMRPRAPGVDEWLRQEFAANAPYDQIVRAMLTGQPGGRPLGNPFFFYQSNEFKPENLAAATSRLFLGVKLECAQCHDHPFAKYSRKQFWELAAFYASVVPGNPQGRPGQAEIVIPGLQVRVQARFPDGADPKLQPGDDPRRVLTDWVVARQNPYFARAAVNRVWEYFFGIGLVDPVDEPGPENPPSHPELLTELAAAFAAHDYDFHFLIRALVSTQAYQRSSRAAHEGHKDLRLFARMAVRGMSPEQFFDSLAQATRFEVEPQGVGPYDPRLPFLSPARAEFLARFPNQDRRTESQTSILQALYLMNGRLMFEATSLEHNRQLRYIADGVSIKTSRKIEQLYLIALSRKPRPDELARLVAYVDKGGAAGDPRKALADVFWALLNSNEFALNH
jgi:hypothetical protein